MDGTFTRVDLTNNFATKIHTARIETVDEKPPRTSNQNEQEESTKKFENLDEFLASQSWVPPYEYYASIQETTYVTDNDTQGFLIANKDRINSGEANSYFWLEEIKNWCMFNYYTESDHDYEIKIDLSVWNGKDGWIRVPNLQFEENMNEEIWNDRYNIKEMQQPFFNKIRGIKTDGGQEYIDPIDNNLIEMYRGWCQDPLTDEDGEWMSSNPNSPSLYYYFNQHNYLQLIKAVRLQKSTNYSINLPGSFQTRRWQSQPYFYIRNITENINNSDSETFKDHPYERYIQTNFRIGMPTGIPCIWRLPTGEIALCFTFTYRADTGTPYHYEAHPQDGFTSGKSWKYFRKYYNKKIDGYSKIRADKMLGDDFAVATKWLNDVCASYFGKGLDKTIELDWLREYNLTIDSSSKVVNYDNMLDSALQFEQQNINKENLLKCSFTVNRPVVTTETVETADYAKKW